MFIILFDSGVSYFTLYNGVWQHKPQVKTVHKWRMNITLIGNCINQTLSMLKWWLACKFSRLCSIVLCNCPLPLDQLSLCYIKVYSRFVLNKAEAVLLFQPCNKRTLTVKLITLIYECCSSNLPVMWPWRMLLCLRDMGEIQVAGSDSPLRFSLPHFTNKATTRSFNS